MPAKKTLAIFRLLVGQHEQDELQEDDSLVTQKYIQGDLVPNDMDLTKTCINKFQLVSGQPMDPAKVKRNLVNKRAHMEALQQGLAQQASSNPPVLVRPPHTPPTPTENKEPPKDREKLEADLVKMTIAELRTYAEEEEINLEGAKDKTAIIKTILGTP